MPPLSTQEQDDEQSNDEAENCSTFGQSCTQQQVGLDLTGSFRLAADGLRCLASGEEARLYGMPRPPLFRGGGSASALPERLNFSYSSPPILSFINSEVRKTKT